MLWRTNAAQRLKNGLAMFKAMPPIRMSEWAEQNFYLSSESSYVAGRWTCYPYQIFMLDAMGHRDIEIVAIKKAARTGYTKCLLAAIAYFSIRDKKNICVWQPTDSDASEFEMTEISPMIRDIPAFKRIFPDMGKKSPNNTHSFKKFTGSLLYIRGASSARNFRRISVSCCICDEISSFSSDIDSEGSPRQLVFKRLEGATFKKMIIGSTPKLRYTCEIDAAVQEVDKVFRFAVPCPHCHEIQVLEFGDKHSGHGLKWFNGDAETACYCCKHCSGIFIQSDYLKIWHLGRWVADDGTWYDHADGTFRDRSGDKVLAPRTVGTTNLWTIYSPQSTWVEIVRSYLAAVKKAKHGDNSDLKTWKNTTQGEVFEDAHDRTDAQDLKSRAEDYPLGIAPRGALILLGGVDVQKDRFELCVWGFGRGEEMFIIDYHVIDADPSNQAEWAKLDNFLVHRYPHAAGTNLHIEHCGIDTGGLFTHQSYQYIRERKGGSGWMVEGRNYPQLYALKGSSNNNQAIVTRGKLVDVNSGDKLIKSGVKLFMVGVDVAKNTLHGRLGVADPGPGYVHFSKSLPDSFFEQMTAEVRVMKQTTRGTIASWVLKRSGARNEAWDCTIYAMWCAAHIALHRKTAAEWAAMENVVQPNQMSLFDDIAPGKDADGNDGLLVRHSSGINLSGWGRH
jgi:phage terminase large subunit GpA-like protein